eukprot:CAMPEP_0205911860 /NCGR_PEP_ID=MMETSP1325-20131115/5437_1 /ASSEMBLY_ACC=CAM_ASM_000708 /TAXON_ID=236786 /ORGANISM="Florenciella sp., Strain RCC1007" /LENGTH=275 /DNA_ID=CAMNT_0053278461 /DNA_START=24 /DNA_END=851 /DNA_ORIENTATION=-
MIKQVFSAAGPVLKAAGKAIDSAGMALEAVPVTEKLVASTKSVAFGGKVPTSAATFVAPTATLIGDVEIGPGSSIWYGARVRADVHSIKIGANSSVGDNAMVHVAKIAGDAPTVIGDNVTIGANALVHACTLESNTVVGTGAQVLDGASVASTSMIAPGAVVTPGTKVPAGQLWSGVPAKHLRDLTAEEIEAIMATAADTASLSKAHALECGKSYMQVDAELAEWEDAQIRHADYLPRVTPGERPEDDVMEQGSPGLIFNSKLKQVAQPKAKAQW